MERGDGKGKDEQRKYWKVGEKKVKEGGYSKSWSEIRRFG